MSDVNPADVTIAAGRAIAEEFPNESTEFVSETDAARKSDREGLPANYRMRADAHYVDQLTSRRAERAERALADTPRAPKKIDTLDPDPAAHEIRDRRDAARERRTDKLFAQMIEDLATIESSAALLAADTSPVARRVSLDLVRSHAWRAAFLVRAHALLEGTHRGVVRARPIGSVLGHVRDGFAPECRLVNVALHVHAADWNAVVSIDESAMASALTGAIVATIGLLGQPDGATIKVSAAASGGELRTIEVAQDEIGVPAAAGQRFFDPTWTDRPGGWSAALGATTARAVAQQHGGEAVLAVAGKRGTTIRLTFSRAS